MLYISEQFPDGRYAIYINDEIAAYISCSKICHKIVESLKSQLPEANRVKSIKEVNAEKHL